MGTGHDASINKLSQNPMSETMPWCLPSICKKSSRDKPSSARAFSVYDDILRSPRCSAASLVLLFIGQGTGSAFTGLLFM